MGKWAKLINQPLAFLLDSKIAPLRWLGKAGLSLDRLHLRHAGRRMADSHVTVIMTAYETADYIARAVNSLLTQHHKNFTLIVVDDACPQQSGQAALRAAAGDPRVLVFRAEKNCGTYVAKNWALSRCAGPFVTFHDSDDISTPDRLQVQLGAMALHEDAIANIVHWQRRDPAGRLLCVDGRWHMLSFITTMIRRAPVLQTIGYFDQVRKAADQNFQMRLLHVFGADRVKRLSHVAYCGTMRKNALTADTYRPTAEGGHMRRIDNVDRAAYRAASLQWLQGDSGVSAGYVPFPLIDRPFKAPQAYVVDIADAANPQMTALHDQGIQSLYFTEAD